MPSEETRARRAKIKARLHRQIDVLRGRHSRLDSFIDWIEDDSTRIFRVPLAILLILGGCLSFLPVLGIWMLPLGLLLLALDFPPLRGPVANVAVRIRRRLGNWLYRKERRNRAKGESSPD